MRRRAGGDAGAVVTRDKALAETVRKLRDHGGTRKYQHDLIGYNSRLDSLQAAVLLVEGFAANWPGSWPDLESAMEEVRESLAAERISRVALDEDGEAVAPAVASGI